MNTDCAEHNLQEWSSDHHPRFVNHEGHTVIRVENTEQVCVVPIPQDHSARDGKDQAVVLSEKPSISPSDASHLAEFPP